MTAAGRPTTHPDLDTLADLDAGVLDPAAAEDVAAHVGGCVRCTAAITAFDAVRADLHDLPPPAMPDSVAARLDATVTDLRRRTGPVPTPAPATPPAAGRPAWSPPVGSPPAGAPGGAPLGAGANQAVPPAGSPPTGSPPTGSPLGGTPHGAGASPAGPPPVADLGRARERRRRSLKLSTGAVAAALVLVAAGASLTALFDTANDKSTSAGAPAGANTLPEGDGPSEAAVVPAYTKETLPGAIETIRRTSAVDEIARLGETGPGGVMADDARRKACEQSIPRGADRALTAVRRIYFEGEPAYVFVFTALGGGGPTAYVVTEGCGTGALTATVLDEVR